MLDVLDIDSLSRSRNRFKYKGTNGLWGICTQDQRKITLPLFEEILDIVKWGNFIRVRTLHDHQTKIINFKGELLPLPYMGTIGTYIPNYFIITEAGKDIFRNMGLYDIEYQEIIPPTASLIGMSNAICGVNLFSFYKEKQIHYLIHDTNCNEIITIKRNNDFKTITCHKVNGEIIEMFIDKFYGRNMTYYNIQINEKVCCIVYDFDYWLQKVQKICLLPVFDKIELLEVIDSNNHIFKVSNNNLWGLFNTEKEICSINYDEITFNKKSYRTKIKNYKLKKGELYGIVTESMAIIEPQYEDIKNISNQHIAIKRNEKWGIINDKNEIIIVPQYKDIFDFNPIYKDMNIEINSNIFFMVETFNKEIKFINSNNIPLVSLGYYVKIGKSIYTIDTYDSKYYEIVEIQKFTTDLSNAYKNSDSEIFRYDSSNIDLSGYSTNES